MERENRNIKNWNLATITQGRRQIFVIPHGDGVISQITKILKISQGRVWGGGLSHFSVFVIILTICAAGENFDFQKNVRARKCSEIVLYQPSRLDTKRFSPAVHFFWSSKFSPAALLRRQSIKYALLKWSITSSVAFTHHMFVAMWSCVLWFAFARSLDM